MGVGVSIRLAVGALQAHGLRAALTILGVVVGVAAVVATISMGMGSQERIAEHMRELGSNLIVVLTGPRITTGVREPGGRLTLSEEDAGAIAAEIPGVEVAAPVMRGTGQAVYGNRNWASVITAVTPDYLVAREWEVTSGSMFGPTDVEGAAKVAVLGDTVWRNLFGDASPLGETVRVRGVPFRILGVLAPKGQSAWGQDQDDVVLIPISTAKRKVLGTARGHPRGVNTILVRVREAARVPDVREQIRVLLRQRHRLQADQEDDFRARLLDEIFAEQQETARTMTWLLGSIAAVSLLVGGIGVMNIMLVSVTERTREIGLRVAVGARRRDILGQFLVEAVVLSALGGLAGVAVGVVASGLLGMLGEWRTEVAPESVILALASAAAVGVFFGVVPAYRASRLDPIEALRRE